MFFQWTITREIKIDSNPKGAHWCTIVPGRAASSPLGPACPCPLHVAIDRGLGIPLTAHKAESALAWRLDMNKTGGLRVLPIGSGVVPPKRAPSSSSVRYTILAAYLCADSPPSDAMKMSPVVSKRSSVAKRLGPEMEFGRVPQFTTHSFLSTCLSPSYELVMFFVLSGTLCAVRAMK